MEVVNSYYATTARIRYYGQIPTAVRKSGDEVRAKGVKSYRFGEDVLSDWENALESAPSHPIDLSRRKEPAHEAFANLALDLNSLHAFTKLWGFIAANADAETGEIFTQIKQIAPMQRLLQRAWTGDAGAIKAIAKDVKVRLDVSAQGIDIAVVELWNLVRLLFLRDYWDGRTKVCANPDCSSRYFLEQRKGQQYCSHKCAVLMNVRRFRQRQTTAQRSKPTQQNSRKGEPK